MTESIPAPLKGGCSCGESEYELERMPMYVHCCHCTWCQKETGSAFAVNALIESSYVSLLKGEVNEIELPTNSGSGQKVVRCSRCQEALWSYYGAAKDKVSFIRVGTLDQPDLCPPDIHIYTSSKQKWVALKEGDTAVEEFYRRSEYWPADAIARYKSAKNT